MAQKKKAAKKAAPKTINLKKPDANKVRNGLGRFATNPDALTSKSKRISVKSEESMLLKALRTNDFEAYANALRKLGHPASITVEDDGKVDVGTTIITVTEEEAEMLRLVREGGNEQKVVSLLNVLDPKAKGRGSFKARSFGTDADLLSDRAKTEPISNSPMCDTKAETPKAIDYAINNLKTQNEYLYRSYCRIKKVAATLLYMDISPEPSKPHDEGATSLSLLNNAIALTQETAIEFDKLAEHIEKIA